MWIDAAAEDFETCLELAERQVDELAQFAAAWDAQAVPPAPSPEPVYVPTALEPREARAADRAFFERAGGNLPRRAGRFYFVGLLAHAAGSSIG